MSRRSSSKASLFIMEMVIALLFFSICSAICLRVFATASQNTSYSRNLGNSSALCQSAAGVYKSCKGNIKQSAEILDGNYDDGQAIIYYDSNWKHIKDSNMAKYELIIENEEAKGNLKTALIYVQKSNSKDNKKIFSITVKTVGDE